MASLTDPFETWLHNLTTLGYDRDWIRRNAQSLRARFESGVPMPPSPPASAKPRERYEEL